MSFWPILLILLAIAMAVGPVMLLQPSSRDRRLANVRQQAAQSGLTVRMKKFTQQNTELSVAVYSLVCALPEDTTGWLLWRRDYEHGIHFNGVWEWQSEQALTSAPIPENQQHYWRHFLDKLPEDIIGVEVNPAQIGLWWREGSDSVSVDMIKSWLQDCCDFINNRQAA